MQLLVTRQMDFRGYKATIAARQGGGECDSGVGCYYFFVGLLPNTRSVTNYCWYYLEVLFLVPLNSTSNSAETSSKNTIFLRGFGTIRGTIRRYYFSAGIFFPREGNTITTSPLPPPHCCHLRRCTVATFAAVLPPPPPPRPMDQF